MKCDQNYKLYNDIYFKKIQKQLDFAFNIK